MHNYLNNRQMKEKKILIIANMIYILKLMKTLFMEQYVYHSIQTYQIYIQTLVEKKSHLYNKMEKIGVKK